MYLKVNKFEMILGITFFYFNFHVYSRVNLFIKNRQYFKIQINK